VSDSRAVLSVISLITLVIAFWGIGLSRRVDELELQLQHAERQPTLLTPLSPQPAVTSGQATRSDEPVTPPAIEARGELSDVERSTIDIFSSRSGSVAHITTVDLREDPFSRRVVSMPSGAGSGFVWDEAGHIVTNYHVTQEASAARVTLSDRSVWNATLVGASARHDLAVLRIEAPAEALHALPVGTSHDLEVGQSVFAIGSPFGLDYTLSTGVISGLGREIPGPQGLPIRDVIQTDAAINPGNSGGPLLDSAGRLIGVNTAIYSPSGASAGVGFAVPVAIVSRVVPQLIQYGREVKPALGVSLANEHLSRRLGVQGALVVEVQAGSPAERAGLRGTVLDRRSGHLRLGDVIESLDGKPVETTVDLYLALEQHKPGDTVELGLQRDGKRVKVSAALVSDAPAGMP